MSNETVLDYIEEHIEELRDNLEQNIDSEDYDWYDGAIESLEHVLIKFRGNND